MEGFVGIFKSLELIQKKQRAVEGFCVGRTVIKTMLFLKNITQHTRTHILSHGYTFFLLNFLHPVIKNMSLTKTKKRDRFLCLLYYCWLTLHNSLTIIIA